MLIYHNELIIHNSELLHCTDLVGVVWRGMGRRWPRPVVGLLLMMVMRLGMDGQRPLRDVSHPASPLAVRGPQVGVAESEFNQLIVSCVVGAVKKISIPFI